MARDVLGKKGLDALFSGRRRDESPNLESEVKSHDFESEVQKSEIKGQKQAGSSQDSGLLTHESGVTSQESRLMSNESEVMSHDIGNKSQDPGLRSNESRVTSQESRLTSSEPEVLSLEKGAISHESGVMTHDPKVLELAISEANGNPRISLWSPLVMAVLRYNQLTKVRYSMSKEASTVLEEAFMEKYPEICEAIKREFNDEVP